MPRGRPPRLKLAHSEIEQFFERLPQKLFQYSDLVEILGNYRERWHLADATSSQRFIEFLLENTRLRLIHLESESHPNARAIDRYAWGKVSALELGASLRKNAYLSHGTAVFLHGLTDQLPSIIYVNKEQSQKPASKSPTLSQRGIDNAFAGRQRQSTFTYSYEDTHFLLLNGKNTGRLEVGLFPLTDSVAVPVTKLERTLIDISVRPAYAGGVFQVVEAFTRAQDRISVSTMIATLRKLNYVYPYHQVLGFYLQKAGFPQKQYDRLRTFGLNYDFYLTYGMREHQYDPYWRLYHPQGL